MRESSEQPLQIRWQIWVVWFVAFAIYSALLPRDAAFDVAHYHLHNGWSAWSGRLDRDMAPADLHSYLNPTHGLLVWWLVERLPGPLVMAILSPVHAAILPALYVFGLRFARRLDVEVSPISVFVLAATGYLALGNNLMHASVGNDHWGVLGFIFAMALVLGGDGRPDWRDLAIGSFVLGALVGMKLTNAVYIPGYAITVLILAQTWSARLRDMVICAIAGALGILLLGAWWAWAMFDAFGNPVFPHLNAWFGSPELGPDESFRDQRYLPDSVLSLIARPFAFSFDTSLIYEYNLRDVRFLFGYVSTLTVLAWLSWRAVRKLDVPQGARAAIAISASFLAVYLVWASMFSILRYANALWILSPVIFTVLLVWVFPAVLRISKFRVAVFALCGAIVLSTSQAPTRRVAWSSWSEPYVWTQLPENLDVDGSIVVFSAHYPSAFTAPAFKSAAWLTHADSQPWSKPALANYRPLTIDRLVKSDRPVYAVMFVGQDSDREDLERLASELGLRARFDGCKRLETAFDIGDMHWVVCPLKQA